MFVARRITNLFNSHSSLGHPRCLDKPPSFSLSLSGTAGLMGGDDAISTMVVVHVYESRQWLGWYNSPGSFQLADRFNLLAKCAFHRCSASLFSKSVHIDPKLLCGYESRKGPEFRAVHSGTVMEETGYLAAIFMKECAAWYSEGKVVHGRRKSPIRITIADLGQGPALEMKPARSSVFTLLLAGIPIATSVCTCVLCAIHEDWCAFSLILIGIVASGISCLVLGAADFVFAHPEPATGSPAGDGILSMDKDIILLRGTEGAVNSVTRGRFFLHFSSEAHFNLLRYCSVLFFIQYVTQLFLLPRASSFGQDMFLTSLGVSGLYNAWLSSLDKEQVHRRFLFERVLGNPAMVRYTLGTRTAAVVFILLVLRPQDPTNLLDELLPSGTKVWRQWKAAILEQLRRPSDQLLFENQDWSVDGFTQRERCQLQQLYDDSRAACNGYRDYLEANSS